MGSSSKPSRSYATPKRDQRAAATRRKIVAAAKTLFLRDGCHVRMPLSI
jgi:hypothetical protein